MRHQAADALFCLQTPGKDQNHLAGNSPILAIADHDCGNQEVYVMTVPVKGVLSEKEFELDQKHDGYFQTAALHVGQPNSQFLVDNRGLPFQKSTVDGAIQVAVPEIHRARILHLAHHPTIAGNPGQWHMHNTFRGEDYWTCIGNDMYATIVQCMSCARNGSLFNHKQSLRLIPSRVSLNTVALEILRTLPWTMLGKIRNRDDQ